MNSSTDFAQAFSSVLGDRAGLVSPTSLFAVNPGPDERRQVALLHSAVESGNYQAALDEFERHPELIEERPLAQELLSSLVEHSVFENREQHKKDAQAMNKVLSLDTDENTLLDKVTMIENNSKTKIREYIVSSSPDAEDLRAEISNTIYGLLQNMIQQSLDALPTSALLHHLFHKQELMELQVKNALNGETGSQLEKTLRETIVPQALQDIYVPLINEHNLEIFRERFQESCLDKLHPLIDA